MTEDTTKPTQVNQCHHTPCPASYLAWHDWAARMARTHRQLRCPTCGRWEIWVPKPPRAVTRPAATGVVDG
jgi:hypothetical protein